MSTPKIKTVALLFTTLVSLAKPNVSVYSSKKVLLQFTNRQLFQGAKVNHRDIDGATPLHKAAFNGKLDCLKILVNAGADLDAADVEEITAVQKVSHTYIQSLIQRLPIMIISKY